MWSLPLLEPPQGDEYPGPQTMALGAGEVKVAQGQGTWNTVTNAGPVQPLTGEFAAVTGTWDSKADRS